MIILIRRSQEQIVIVIIFQSAGAAEHCKRALNSRACRTFFLCGYHGNGACCQKAEGYEQTNNGFQKLIDRFIHVITSCFSC